jgi:hypothetical protein
LNWNGTANFSGNVQITGGTVNITASITSLAAAGVTISGLSNIVSGAYLTNCTITGAERITGTVNWAGGTLNDTGSLMVTPTGGVNLIGPGSFSVEGPLTNNGTVNWQGGSIQVFNNNNSASYLGGIWNLAQWNIQCSQELSAYYGNGYEIFHNSGTVTKSGVAGTTTFSVGLNNAGTLDVEAGTLNCTGGDTLAASGSLVFGLNSLTSWGALNLSGDAALAGSVSAHLNGGYVPTAVGNSFPVLTFGASTGGFNFTNLPAAEFWQPIYSSTTLSLAVVRLVPKTTWPKPATMVYGTALSASQLDAIDASPVVGGTNIVGAYTYTPPVGTILDSGSNQTLTVRFTPKDSAVFTNVTASVTLNVLPAPLTLTAKNSSKPYGQTIPFAGTEFSASGLVNGDLVTSVTLTSAGASPTVPVSGSPYAITLTNAVGDARLTNYNITYVSGSLAVSPAALTITASPESKTYGQTLVFGSGSTLFIPAGLQNGETIGSVTLAASGNGGAPTAPVTGTLYILTPTLAAGGTFTPGNYSIKYALGSLQVNPATLIITADNTNKQFGATLVFTGAEFMASGLQNGETIGSVHLYSAGVAAAAPVGGYSIVPSAPTGGTFAGTNYSEQFVDGTLTVSGPTLSLRAQGGSFVLSFPGLMGQTYQLQYKTNLASATWANLGGEFMAPNETISLTIPAVPAPAFFQLAITQ